MICWLVGWQLGRLEDLLRFFGGSGTLGGILGLSFGALCPLCGDLGGPGGALLGGLGSTWAGLSGPWGTLGGPLEVLGRPWGAWFGGPLGAPLEGPRSTSFVIYSKNDVQTIRRV